MSKNSGVRLVLVACAICVVIVFAVIRHYSSNYVAPIESAINEAVPNSSEGEQKQTLIQLHGKEIARDYLPDLNGVRIFYYTPTDDQEKLLQIAERYKQSEVGKAYVEIMFFNDEANAPRALPMNDYGVACFMAKFEYAPSQGRQILQRKSQGWKEDNQGL